MTFPPKNTRWGWYALFFSLILLIACSDNTAHDDEPPIDEDTPHFIRTTNEINISSKIIKPTLEYIGFEDYAFLISSDVQLLSITYRTGYSNKNPLNASGLLIIPSGFDPSLPVIVYNHGTITNPEQAPSLTRFNIKNLLDSQALASISPEVVICSLLSSIGDCVVIMPDYIGYGESSKTVHPYIHRESLGKASLDLVLACKEYLEGTGKTFNPDLFITGYSEGGFAAVALHRAIQENPSSKLGIKKTIAGSGPYDLEGSIQILFAEDRTLSNNKICSYLWTIDMLKREFRYSKDYSLIFSASDYTLLKSHQWDLAYFRPEAYKGLNRNPQKLFHPDFLRDVTSNNEKELALHLRENSFNGFIPKDSLIFVYGSKDDWVPPFNAINTYNEMKAKGAPVALYEVADGTHNSTLTPYVKLVLERYFGLASEIQK